MNIINKNIILPLQVFSKIVQENPANKIDVTISVHGHLITGQLVSPSIYYKELKRYALAGLEEKDDADLYHDLHTMFERMINVQDTDKDTNLFFNYICIRNPVFILGNASDNSYPVNGLPYWIGKIESVDGFALGELDTVIDNNNQSLK